MNLERELELCKKLAALAGQEILKIYSLDFEVEFKEDDSPLTLADKNANDLIINGLQEQFPQYSILSEESKDTKERLNNDWCFIVDPLDGTKEFVKKNDEFTVNIGLAYKNRVVLGVIYVPVTKELYYAMKGKGSFYELEGKTEINRVSDINDNPRMMISRSHLSEELKVLIEKNGIKNTKQVGSSLKGCLIAQGKAEIYYRFGLTMEWDTCAMQCIVEEAGGILRQMDGSEMTYNRENSLNDKGFYILNREENKLK